MELKTYNYDTKEVEITGEVSERDLRITLYEPEDFAKFLTTYLNYFRAGSRLGTEIAKNLLNEHRTLQATTIRFAMGILLGMAQQEYTDARNEMPVEMCRKIKQMVDDGELRMGWMI